MTERLITLPFDVALLPVEELYAGDISCWYEHGNLRYIRFGGGEFVRMIYTAVRDANWETAPYEISNEEIRRGESSFEINYTATYELNDIHYRSYISIIGRDDSSVVFRMKGEALSTFEKNRIGLCLLHPINKCANKSVMITRPDLTTYNSVFPALISPHQPFRQVHKMEWNVGESSMVKLVFEGDVFETEDQRNWTDNSYKTYSTPLELAAPAKVSKGEMMEQSISLKIIKNVATAERTIQSTNPTPGKFHLPKIGCGRDQGSKRFTENEILLLKNILPDHYRATILMSSKGWREELTISDAEARTLDTPLELIVLFSEKFVEEAKALIEQLESIEANVRSILPLHTAHKTTPFFLLEHVYKTIKNAFSDINIGYGTDAFFAELNRYRPGEIEYDFVSFSMYPQVHATDTRTIIENLESLPHILETIEQFTSKPIHISPITFGQRNNLHNGNNEVEERPGEANIDPRLHTWFCAAWTLLVLKNLCKANQLTFFLPIRDSEIKDDSRSPTYKTLLQLKQFGALYIVTGSEPRKIVFENSKGELLSYLVDQSFYPIL
jgi:hypothetical protein